LTTIQRLLTKFPIPWSVRTGKLRPQFPVRIVEIMAADGAIIVPWSSFDAMDLNHREQIAMANLIVNSITMVHANVR